MKKLSKIISVLLTFLFVLVFQRTCAQDLQKRLDEEARMALAQTQLPASEEKGLAFDYGGWFNYRYLEYRNEDNDFSREDSLEKTHWIDSRLWLKATLKRPPDSETENEIFFYVRVKDLMVDNEPESTAGGWDHDGPHLEYGYLGLESRPLKLNIGRQYLSVGQGIAYSDVGDGVNLMYLSPQWAVKTFLARSLPHVENIDESIPGFDKGTDRYFYGIQCGYLGMSGQEFYTYALIQKDYSDARPEDPGHDYRYNSEYVGLGAEGRIRSDIYYSSEVVRETGSSYIYETDEKEHVDAWAGDFKISYKPNIGFHPDFSFEYAYGSGDADRVSVTDTVDGNAQGNDRNFLYFGYFPSGYALSPRLSNLHLFRSGILLRPLEKNPVFKYVTFGVDYYRFYKDKAGGGIYDPEASQEYKNVGSEADLTVGWRICSDVGCSIEYGHFFPGKAYPDSSHDSESFFSVSTTFTF